MTDLTQLLLPLGGRTQSRSKF